MSRGLLPEHLGPLVDRLRSGDHQAVSLPDVAALTEVLMRSLESYFKSIDLTIYQECQSLADYINDARQEISSLSPNNDDEAGIPRAGLELEAIVQQTESATNTIMESAERIMEADPNDMPSYTDTVNDAVMQIFEACSFQDITGQRISKVVSTLEHVEERVASLVNILGVMEGPKKNKAPKEEIDPDKALLNGPALEGEGIDQSEIDALLNGDDGDFDGGDFDGGDLDNTEEIISEAQTPEEDVMAKEEENIPKPSPNNLSTDDIDFMFDGQEDVADEVVSETVIETINETVVKAKEEPAPAAVPKPNLIEQAKQQKAAAQAEKKAKDTPPPKPVAYEEGPKVALEPKQTENTTQSDIDALFS
ncbi:MAG: protein phosphatase CheZ [Emcibacter sp.]|nr:protein phosphatase CheZ [Emcibacter sp.]